MLEDLLPFLVTFNKIIKIFTMNHQCEETGQQLFEFTKNDIDSIVGLFSNMNQN